MNVMKRLSASLLILLLVVLASSCSTLTSVLPQQRLIAMVQTGKVLNPNDRGRPSPLSVSFYQLKGREAFDGADFFSLYDKGKETLGDDFIAVSKANLTPGTEARLTLTLKSGVKFIGIVGAYNDVNNTKWRKVIPIEFSFGRKKVRLRFTQRGIGQYSVLKTGLDIKAPDFDKPSLDDLSKKQSGPNLNYEVLKHVK
jgi:type VI secretion system protein VasD